MSDSSSWNPADRVLEGARFDVFEVDFPRHGGGDSGDSGAMRREVVVPADAVVILPLLDERTVLLIRNERFAVGRTLWELPAGTMEAGETPGVCAARELTEETGYAAKQLTELCAFYSSPGFCTEKLTVFLAEALSYRGQNLDETERIEVHPTPLEEVKAMIRDHRICDAKTIAAVLYYLQFGRGDR